MTPEPNQPLDPTAPAWYAHWDNFSPNTLNQEVDQMSVSEDMSPEEEWQDWQIVDFPKAISIDAIERHSASQPSPTDWAGNAIPTPSIATPTQSPTFPSEQPNIAELISLIQELNQCNSTLIDRVSQLEEALEQSQQHFVTEQGRSPQRRVGDLQDLPAQEQILHLVNQLESSQQSHHRHQILIETLKHQLTSSQERVAQLERECAVIQDQCKEYSHQLMQSEHVSRDLHHRLQRQQRYTLQYKAALEKCLDTSAPNSSAPNYETNDVVSPLVAESWYETASPLVPQPFLPKVHRIQPWSASSPPLVGKLEALANLQNYEESTTDSDVTEGIAPPAPSDLTALTEFPTQLTSPATGQERIDDEVTPRPLAAETGDAPLSPLSPEAIQAGLTELQSVLGRLWATPSMAAAPDEAEAHLWQNLARLIDVSTDDVLKASTAEEFTEFGAIASDDPLAEDATTLDTTTLDATTLVQSPPTQSQPTLTNTLTHAERKLHLPTPSVATEIPQSVGVPRPASTAVDLLTPPSPLLYPTRSTKKRESLAAVELPTFPRPTLSHTQAKG